MGLQPCVANCRDRNCRPLRLPSGAMTDRFVDRARRHAAQWKATSPTLPEGARGPAPYLRDNNPRGMYPFCLPAGYATYNLLPDVRESALRDFAENKIVWHAKTALGP